MVFQVDCFCTKLSSKLTAALRTKPQIILTITAVRIGKNTNGNKKVRVLRNLPQNVATPAFVTLRCGIIWRNLPNIIDSAEPANDPAIANAQILAMSALCDNPAP